HVPEHSRHRRLPFRARGVQLDQPATGEEREAQIAHQLPGGERHSDVARNHVVHLRPAPSEAPVRAPDRRTADYRCSPTRWSFSKLTVPRTARGAPPTMTRMSL